MAVPYQIPGVYFEPRPRAPDPFRVRTDVVGFIGFEPRLRDGTTPSSADASGWAARVDLAGFQLALGGKRVAIGPAVDLVVDRGAGALAPVIPAGSTVRYAVYVAAPLAGPAQLRVFPPPPASVVPPHPARAAAPDGEEAAPSDDDVVAAVEGEFGDAPWMRIADVAVRNAGGQPAVTVHPALRITRCDDWRDYLLAFGEPREDGTFLGHAVRAYFANGGRRCWVSTVRRPGFYDAVELARALDDFVGVRGDSEAAATGLERLLLQEEVTVVDAPDLHARRIDRTVDSYSLPPRDVEACFLPCAGVLGGGGVATSALRDPGWTPLYDASAMAASPLFSAQKALLARCIAERWRAMLLLSVPIGRDPHTGDFGTPGPDVARAWVDLFDALVKSEGFAEDEAMAAGALYWPWLRCQEIVGGPTLDMPPSSYAAGVLSRRDLDRGPGVAPANETLRQVFETLPAVTDTDNAALYEPPLDAAGLAVPSLNVVRGFAGYGVQVWGARTLSTDAWLRFVPVRRALTAVELRMKAALDAIVFEPNTPLLWVQVTHAALGVLVPLFEQGVLRGDRIEDAFYARCDDSVNPPEAVAAGQLVVEIGVAIAAPAEFIVFRVGRREGVVEVLESWR